ncbi:LlaMI family restriction endonuclease [Mycoplasma sp. ES3157-GEN-MYC]|nr:LlaMI family restriction endonuclease [Mycoplasma miroungigenitalium]
MIIEPNKDIVIKYSYSKDQRQNKHTIIPLQLQHGEIELARWFGSTSPSSNSTDKSLKDKLENKFNQKDWFTCKTDSDGRYKEICFGGTFNFEQWIDLVTKGIVFFDSGMHQGNKRPYSQWRANNKYWDSLIIERYE